MNRRSSRARWISRCRQLLASSGLVAAALTFAGNDASAQSLTLEYQQTVTQTIPGATAAFSLDQACVGAAARDGTVTMVGRAPGSTHVIVVIGDRFESFRIVVGDPPSFSLPGLTVPGAPVFSTGSYEVRYGSDPRMLQSVVRLSERQGERAVELLLGGAVSSEDHRSSVFSIPQASYTVRSAAREVTLLDRIVTNSPLTISRSNIRGVHLREGPVQVHVGYSFFANFEHLLLPTHKEPAVGLSYRYRLNHNADLKPSVYYIGADHGTGRRGVLGTLLYEARPAKSVKLLGEVGIGGRVAAAAAELKVERPTQRAWARLRFAPEDLPALSTDQPNGRLLEAGWMNQGDRLDVHANVSSHGYAQGSVEQTASVARLDLQYQLHKAWTIHAGPGYSSFTSGSRPESDIHSVMLPVGAGFTGGPMGVGLDYQFSRETTRDLAGHLVRANVHGASGGFHVSAYGERQTQAPTAGYILARTPWLQQTLDRLGIAATTPEQLAQLLRTNAVLSAVGYANRLTINVTPVRTRLAASAGWFGSGAVRPQLSLNTLVNRDELIDRTSRTAVHTVSYSQKLGPASDLFVTWSLFCTEREGPSSSCRPIASVALRRRFGSIPNMLMPGRRSEIRGTVFRDDEGRGTYGSGMSTLADVEVVLDGVRRTRTDASGRFRFAAVPYGTHRVEARPMLDGPFFFTTPSPRQIDAGGTADFGIGFALARLRGVLRTDAGAGPPGVVIHVAGGERRFTAQTGGDGAFAVEALPPGTYDVGVEPGSLPPGYQFDDLAPQRVTVEMTSAAQVTLVLRAYRSVAGRVRLFDRQAGSYVPLTGATVEVRELQRRCTTDANGGYIFRDLPSGEHTLAVTYEAQAYIVPVALPEGQAVLKDVDIAVVPVVMEKQPGAR